MRMIVACLMHTEDKERSRAFAPAGASNPYAERDRSHDKLRNMSSLFLCCNAVCERDGEVYYAAGPLRDKKR